MNRDKWLVIDDDFDILTILESFLKDHEIDCVCINDPQQIHHILAKNDICGVISDYVMPQLNGFQVHDIVRNQHKLKDIPFILLSGRTDVAYDQRFQTNDKNHYLPKPLNYERLLKLVAREIKQKNVLLDPKDYQTYEVEGFCSNAKNSNQLIPVVLLDFNYDTMHFEVERNSLRLNSTYLIELKCHWEGKPLNLIFDGLVINITVLDATSDEVTLSPLNLNPRDFEQIAALYRDKQLKITDFLNRARGVE